MTAKYAILLTAAALSGCPAGSTGDSRPDGPNPPSGESVEVTTVNQGDGTLAPPSEIPEAASRHRRRMDIDQLDAAIRQVTGGIGWTERRGNTEVNLFDELAGTLGKPDFIQLVDEDLEPSAMFQKFLDDAARAVCDRLMQVDPQRPAAERVFFQSAAPTTNWSNAPDAVIANLQYLLLRYHGRKVGPDAPELNPWTWLSQSSEHVGASPLDMWRTVCVGLMTHPDFYTY